MDACNYTRRSFLKTMGVGAASLMLPCCLSAGLARQDKPNIILFISDDHGWADAGCYGNNAVRTPNIDKLAIESMRFTHAFAGAAICTPSRSLIYTGLMPFRNGARIHNSRIRPGTKALPHYMSQLGYRVVLAGKTHILPLDGFGFEYLPAKLSGSAAESLPRVYGDDLDTDAIDKLLAEHVENKSGQPICLIVASWAPHVVWRWKKYDPAKVVVPPYLVDTPATRNAIAKYYTDVSLMDEKLGACLESVEKHGLKDNTMFIYTTDQGAQFPHAKWNLYDAGIRVPLTVRWPGKVKPGSVSDAMVSLVDLLPSFIEASGGTSPTDIDGLSFLSVLLGKTKQHRKVIFATHTGDNWMNDFPMRCIRTGTHKYILNLKPENLYTNHITNGKVRDGLDYWRSWLEAAKTDKRVAKIVHDYQHRPVEELYDLRSDPYEMNNIAAEPANSELLASLRGQVADWRKKQSDVGAQAEL